MIKSPVNASDITSFASGGEIENLVTVTNVEELQQAVVGSQPIWVLGDGANVLISDKGLPGTTLKLDMRAVKIEDTALIADAGAEWDDMVQKAIEAGLWGVELTSGIPGTVGAGIVGNIAAYGQAVSDSLVWVEVIDRNAESPELKRLDASELQLEYRNSALTNPENSLIVIRAGFALSKTKTTELRYESAVVVANELNLDTDSLNDRRTIIMEARRRAGSLLEPGTTAKTAGSFFKNPLVTPEQAELVMSFEEYGVNKGAIQKQNTIHGGDAQRVSGAHVILAAGFQRGQTWGDVRIHPDHALKIENTGNASSQDIYNVAMEIKSAAKAKLGIDLVPEVRFMGDFS